MLPYWYKRMYDGDPGTFKRGRAGQSIVYKHQDVFILGHLEHDRYQPILNISVMPWSTKNLAPSIWHQLYLQTVREREAQPYNKGGSAWSKPGPILVTVLVSILVFNSFCFVIQLKSRRMRNLLSSYENSQHHQNVPMSEIPMSMSEVHTSISEVPTFIQRRRCLRACVRVLTRMPTAYYLSLV